MVFANMFTVDALSSVVASFVVFFTAIIFVYSLGFIKQNKFEYYFWFFLTAAASLGVVCTTSIWLIIILWGFLGLALFQLINILSNDTLPAIAKKTFIIIGASDGLMLLGFLLYIQLTSRVSLGGAPLVINSGLALASFLMIAVGCFAKAGCMPFHTWIPPVAEHASVPVVAYLPASLDKLLGIYLLARIVKDTFVLNTAAQVILLLCGATTVLFAVMMALIQHNMRRLLGYHAVSQVGYMVLGIALATPLGLAAGLFHMINHAIYKSCLFLGAGNVESQTQTSELSKLGGLARYMPLTFIITLIASFSISGIPPFNGFVSKWMVYQGLIESMQNASSFGFKIVIAASLVMALIGSGLTLASFLKLLSGVYLGEAKHSVKEVGFLQYVPCLILATLCIVLGLFFKQIALPVITASLGLVHISGFWQPLGATGLILVGLILGLIVFNLSKGTIRTSPVYLGGEALESDVKVEDFYKNIQDLPFLKKTYTLAKEGYFDLYEQGKRLVFFLTGGLRYLHNGILPTYLVWCLLGMMGLWIILLR